MPREAWQLTNVVFESSFGFWTQVRDRIAGNAYVSESNLVDWLFLCYNDGLLTDIERLRLGNRERQSDEVTLYHLLTLDMPCPAFAGQDSYSERTAGRFASKQWATSTFQQKTTK